MNYFSNSKKQYRNQTPKWTVKNKTDFSNHIRNKERKEIIVRKHKDFSELVQSFKNTVVRNISIDFNFPNTKNAYIYKRSFPIGECPMFEQKNIFYYDSNFQLFKNKSVSKFAKPNNKANLSTNQNKINNPQHNIITTIKRVKALDDSTSQEHENQNDKRRNSKTIEKDIYQLEVINQVIFNGTGENKSNMKNYRTIEGKNYTKDEKESESGEWDEIEQKIFENEKDKKNNLLNTVNVEIEKENGDKQLVIVEISKKDKHEDQFAEIVSLEKRNIVIPEFNKEDLYSYYEKDYFKDSSSRNSYDKTTYTNSTHKNIFLSNSFKNNDSLNLKKEKASEIFLNEFNSKKRLFTSIDAKKNNLEKVMNLKPFNRRITKEKEITPFEKEIYNKRKKIENKVMDIIKDTPINNNKFIGKKEEYFIRKNNPTIKEEKNNNISEIKNRRMKVYNITNEKLSKENENNRYGKNISQNKKIYRYEIKNQIENNKKNIRGENNSYDRNKNSYKNLIIERKDKIKEKETKTENKYQPIRNIYKSSYNFVEEKPKKNSIEIIQNRRIIQRNKSSGLIFQKEEKNKSQNKTLINRDGTRKELKTIETLYKSKRIYRQNNQNEYAPKIKDEIKENNYENKFRYTRYSDKNNNTQYYINEKGEREKREMERQRKLREKREQEERERKLRERKEQEGRKSREKKEREEKERKLRERQEKEKNERKLREKKEREERERKIKRKKEQEERERRRTKK